METSDFKLRLAVFSDVESISRLISSCAGEFVLERFSPEAKALFLRSVEPEAIANNIAHHYRYYVAERERGVVGVIGIREHRHLYHLFVDKSAHRQGLGRLLWACAKDACLPYNSERRFTVNASSNALSFYRSIGFVETGPEHEKMGIVSTPMCWSAPTGKSR